MESLFVRSKASIRVTDPLKLEEVAEALDAERSLYQQLV